MKSHPYPCKKAQGFWPNTKKPWPGPCSCIRDQRHHDRVGFGDDGLRAGWGTGTRENLVGGKKQLATFVTFPWRFFLGGRQKHNLVDNRLFFFLIQIPKNPSTPQNYEFRLNTPVRHPGWKTPPLERPSWFLGTCFSVGSLGKQSWCFEGNRHVMVRSGFHGFRASSGLPV